MTVRLLDPPLHEFLPRGAEEIARLAETLGTSTADVERRVAALEEFNPMLGIAVCGWQSPTQRSTTHNAAGDHGGGLHADGRGRAE